ncbi:hypothetical protein [Tritonibacter mobilis]|uniref:hypothetical protein n=1 Tax=Tritonibacter mobilis TaxID=379347 RepID=UPI003873503E
MCLTLTVMFGAASADDRVRWEPLVAGRIDRAVPDFSTLSRRQQTLSVSLPYRGSTGIKAEKSQRICETYHFAAHDGVSLPSRHCIRLTQARICGYFST